jgi:hypothetical protein
LIYWSYSEVLKNHPRPDPQYAWNLAVTGLQEEFMAPRLETIEAALVDLNGRPICSITGNVIKSSRTVAIAHILGLNRDPTTWNILQVDKNKRIRLWWGVIIHDRWWGSNFYVISKTLTCGRSSFAHGVPSNITKDQYDVPLCELQALLDSNNTSPLRVRGAKCFIALCSLTNILGDVLPLLYNLHIKTLKDASKRIRRIKVDLDEWEEEQADWLIIESGKPPAAGSSSLQLGFLAVKMLLCRLSLKVS